MGSATLYCTIRIIFYYIIVFFVLFLYSKYKFFFNHFYSVLGGWGVTRGGRGVSV